MCSGASLALVMISIASSREVLVCALLVPAKASVVGAPGVIAAVVAAALEELKRRDGSCVRIELDCTNRGLAAAVLDDNAPNGAAAGSRALRVVDEENCVVRVSSVNWLGEGEGLTDLMEISSSRRRPMPMVRLDHCIPLLGIMAGCRRRCADKCAVPSPRNILMSQGSWELVHNSVRA
jgi:hypothetical protein